MGKLSIDTLAPKRSLIDLSDKSLSDFSGFISDDFILSFIFDDILLVEYIDEVNDGQGDTIVRGGIHIPVNTLQKAWRKAKVILVGPKCEYTKKNDIVVFPSNYGVNIRNVEIDGYGMLKKGVFLNENRLFGICKQKQSKK